MKVLLSWLAFRHEMIEDAPGIMSGPLLTVLSQYTFEKVVLLHSGPETKAKAEALKRYVSDNPNEYGNPEFQFLNAELDDPTDYVELWIKVPQMVMDLIQSLASKCHLSINMSGTAAMSTTWLMMVGTGELQAELLSAQDYNGERTVKPVRIGIYPYVEKIRQQLEPRLEMMNLFASNSMKEIIRDLSILAKGTGKPILLLGETGTGKTELAKIYHRFTGKPQHSLYHLVCGEFKGADLHLVQGRLFGYRKGAFTGAFQDENGILEHVNGGTLFLDEIGDIPLEVQRLLIDTIETGRFRRMGETQNRRSQFKLICATNSSIKELLERNKLSEDFYYRFGALSFTLPPLRERPEDLKGILKKLMSKDEFKDLNFTEDGKEALQEHLAHMMLYGNIREVSWILSRLELFQKRHYSELDAEAVDAYFVRNPSQQFTPEFQQLVDQLLNVWPETIPTSMKWKDAIVSVAIQQLASRTEFQKKNGSPRLQAIADRLGLDISIVRNQIRVKKERI